MVGRDVDSCYPFSAFTSNVEVEKYDEDVRGDRRARSMQALKLAFRLGGLGAHTYSQSSVSRSSVCGSGSEGRIHVTLCWRDAGQASTVGGLLTNWEVTALDKRMRVRVNEKN